MIRAGLLSVLFCALLTLGGAATAANAEEEPWWEQCEELPSDEIEACFREHNGEGEQGERPPTKPTAPLVTYINRGYPAAHAIFANCPLANRFGERDVACEFRFLSHGRVTKGKAGVEAEGEDLNRTAWWLLAFHAQHPASRHWLSCRVRHAPYDFPEPVRLAALGTPCAEASEIAIRIGVFDVSPRTFRLPHRFTEGEFQANTLGFVVARYQCRGKVQIRQGNPNPYGHETASCRTRFGDRLIFVFNKGS